MRDKRGQGGNRSFGLCSQNVSGLMLKKELLLLIIELVVVILNQSIVIHLWRPQKMTNSLNEASQSSKQCLKTLLIHKNCGSSVQVNGISYGIRSKFMWQNATHVCYTKKKQPSICRILHSLKFRLACMIVVQ